MRYLLTRVQAVAPFLDWHKVIMEDMLCLLLPRQVFIEGFFYSNNTHGNQGKKIAHHYYYSKAGVKKFKLLSIIIIAVSFYCYNSAFTGVPGLPAAPMVLTSEIPYIKPRVYTR